MPTQINKVKIFVASPGDVQSEREQLSRVINELNLTISAIAPEKGIVQVRTLATALEEIDAL